MLTQAEKKYLKSYASEMKISEHIGKEGITRNVLEQVDKNLVANEICKIKILPNSLLNSKEILSSLAISLGAEPVQAIGRMVVLYRYNPKSKNHVLDKK